MGGRVSDCVSELGERVSEYVSECLDEQSFEHVKS